jgi:predicted anti-sigma-YlaC factor YlaD
MDQRHLDEMLRAKDGDAGCTAGEAILDAYVELELAGEDPARVYPGTAIHLQSCPGCQADHEGLLEAARQFGDIQPSNGAETIGDASPKT